ncbi:MAG: D-2-hydroxyacid dehydrogenase [Clostridia bacterium]|nr:D-2-hydroxyacid dehydrogenase [Clostridia bacterium]
MKIVVLDGYTLCPGDLDYGALGELGEVIVYERTPPELAAERIADAPVILTNKVPITREVIDACPALRYVGVLATGYNVVDVQAAAQRGIVVTNVPAYSTQAVVQHAIALLLHDLSRVAAYDAQVKAGRWQRSEDFCFFAEPMEEIAGKTLGIVGFGHIGQAMARAAGGLGMRVLVHTPHPRDGWNDVQFVTLEALLGQSDVISLHCPLTEKTRGLIDARAIEMMRRGVRVINTARGPLIDGAAMAQALREGHVACYMADVMEAEPPRAGDPLLDAPNTVITPHVAWAPRQTRERLLRTAVGNVRAFLAGEPRNVVG